VQIGDTQLLQVIGSLGDTLEISGEQIYISGITEHLRMLKPLWVGMPAKVEQSKVGGALAEIARRDAH
jgi:hypothetical protein